MSYRTHRPNYHTPTQRQDDNAAFRILHVPRPLHGRAVPPSRFLTEGLFMLYNQLHCVDISPLLPAEAERRTDFANAWLIRFKPIQAYRNAPGISMSDAATGEKLLLNLKDGGDYVFQEWNSVFGGLFNWKIVISPTWKGYEDLNWDTYIDTRGRHCIITDTLVPWTRYELAYEIAHIYSTLKLYIVTPPDELDYPRYPGVEYIIPTTNLPRWRIGGDLCPDHRLIMTGMYPCFKTGKWMVKVDVIKPDNSIAPISVDEVDIWTGN